MKTTFLVLKQFHKKIKISRNFDIIFLFFFTLTVYIHNLSPSVYGGDAGDFITAAITRGVAHPSGYPLYTILAILTLLLPITASAAWKVGIVSPVLSSMAVVVMYLITYQLIKRRDLSILSGLTLAFIYPFWLYAEIVEVMALNNLFILTLLLLIITYINTNKQKYIYALAFVTGLSLTNNLTILLLFPAIFLSILVTNRKIFLNFGVLLKSAGFFLLGLVPYFYIPLAARNNPLINWGRAVNYQNFVDLVLRRDYGWFHSKSFNIEVVINALKTYSDYWSVHVNILIPITTLLGVVYFLLKKKYAIVTTVLISYLLFGPLFIIYGFIPVENLLLIGTFEKFYIAGFIILLIFFPFGIALAQEAVSKLLINKLLINLVRSAILIVAVLIPGTSLIVNFERTNLSDVYIGDNYALDILTSLPENSVLLLKGDTNGFNTTYMQIAYNVRPDLYIPGRQEGFTQILKEAGFTDEEIQAYTIEKRSGIEREIVASTIGPMLTKKPIFSDINREIIDNEYGRIVSIPYGLLYKLEFDNNLPYAKEEYISEITKITSLYHINALKEHEELLSYNLILADIKKWYSIAFFRIGEYLVEEYDDLEGAAYFIQLAGELDPLI